VFLLDLLEVKIEHKKPSIPALPVIGNGKEKEKRDEEN
jgi:hypothetical protein